MVDIEMLKQLSLINGVYGYEKHVTRFMKSYLLDIVDEIQYDGLGSIIALKRGKMPLKVLLTAHVDEIGFLVKNIDEHGFIQVQPVGGWNPRYLPSSLMNIETRDGHNIKGVFACKQQISKEKALTIDDMYLDVGALSKQDVLDMGVGKGDPVTPVSHFIQNGKCLLSKAWDDRVGVAVLMEVMKRLYKEKIDPMLYVAGTVQEEVGLRGAKTVAQMIQPDLALAIDVTFSYDLPGGEQNDVRLGQGVALCVMDGSVIAHTGLLKQIEDICQRHQIRYQLDMDLAGGTDSGELSKAGSGIMNLTVSIPTRYMHSHYTMVHTDDFEATVEMLVAFLKEFDEKMYLAMLEDKR